MNKILLAPVFAGYSTEEGFDIISSNSPKGGKPRIRAGITENPKLVNVTWECNREWYKYLREAYRVLARDGLPPFIIDLPLDDSLVRPHIARIVPGTFKLSNVEGHAYRVTARLSVLPNPRIVLVYTSTPYPYEGAEALMARPAVPVGGYMFPIQIEHLDTVPATPLSGVLTSVLQQYSQSVPEELNSFPATPQTGTLQSVLHTFSQTTPEELNSAPAIPISGTLVVVLVSYTHSVAEALNTSPATPMSGTLS